MFKSKFGSDPNNCISKGDYDKEFIDEYTINPGSCIPNNSCDSGWKSSYAIDKAGGKPTFACCNCSNTCTGPKCPKCNLVQPVPPAGGKPPYDIYGNPACFDPTGKYKPPSNGVSKSSQNAVPKNGPVGGSKATGEIMLTTNGSGNTDIPVSVTLSTPSPSPTTPSPSNNNMLFIGLGITAAVVLVYFLFFYKKKKMFFGSKRR